MKFNFATLISGDQSGTLRQYPEVMAVTSFYSLMGAAQCAVVSFTVERELSTWKLKLDTELPLIIVTVNHTNQY